MSHIRMTTLLFLLGRKRARCCFPTRMSTLAGLEGEGGGGVCVCGGGGGGG